jgi:hypothetical protein
MEGVGGMMREESSWATFIEEVADGEAPADEDDSIPSWPGGRRRIGRRGNAWDLVGESFKSLSFQRVEHYSEKRKKDIASFLLKLSPAISMLGFHAFKLGTQIGQVNRQYLAAPDAPTRYKWK